MDLLQSSLAMNNATKAGRLASQGAVSCLTQLSLEPGQAMSDGWPMHTRSKLEWDEGGNVQQDNSSSSEQTVAALQRRIGPASGVKRKAGSTNEGRSKESISRREGQDPPSDEEKLAKCPRTTGGVQNGNFDDTKLKAERSTSEQSGDMSPGSLKENSQIQDLHPKQDYIHVRARRGQATDSHSLAERVRREKISERMKFLQDLVPGCSKVTGKAVMLDEIINYVQSLEHQIEFLSMKLAAIDSRLDSNLENLLQKELVGHPRSPETAFMGPHILGGYRDYQSQSQPQIQQHISSCNMDLRSVGTFCDSYLRRSMNAPVLAPLADTDCFMDSLTQTLSEVCDEDLQTIVQMGSTQVRQDFFGQAGYYGHLKVEY